MMNPLLYTGAAIFILVVVFAFSFSYLSDFPADYGPLVIKQEAAADPWDRELWPLALLLLAMFYLKQDVYNPKSVALLVVALAVTASAYAFADARDLVQFLIVAFAVATIALNFSANPFLPYAIPWIFALGAAGYLFYYFDMVAQMRFVLALALISAVTVLSPPRNWLDSLTLLIAGTVFAK